MNALATQRIVHEKGFTSLQVREPDELILANENARLNAAVLSLPKSLSCQLECEQVSSVMADCKRHLDALEEERREFVDPLNATVKKINAKYKPFTLALQGYISDCKNLIGQYHVAQEQRARIEQARAEERARREQEKLHERALAAADKGDMTKAVELEQRASMVVATAPAVETGKVSGASTRMEWTGEVTDLVALCAAIGRGELPPTLIDVKQIELNRLAKTWQDTREYPGLRFAKRPVVSARR